MAVLNFRPSASAADRDAALGRRAAWQPPSGVEVIAEYWPMAERPAVVSIFSTDSIASIMELTLEWADVFEIEVFPVVTAEEGLRIGQEVFGRLRRLQESGG